MIDQEGLPEPAMDVRVRAASWLGGGDARTGVEQHATLIRHLEELFEEGVEPEVGDHIGGFVLRSRIGRGGMGAVFVAQREHSERRVALKVVSAADPLKRAALVNEADLLPRARHPNIVGMVDAGQDSSWAWLALSLVEGETLADRLAAIRAADRQPDTRELITWCRDLARALAILHEAGLVHRDIKPANIVFDHHGRPILIDFGLAREIGGAQVETYLAGSLPYMSPEQTQAGFAGLTNRTDVYSLAITIHEALTGHRFAIGHDANQIIQRVAFTEVPPPSRLEPKVPSTLDPIFVRALAKHPRDRYANADELAEDLDRWLGGRALAHTTERKRARIARFARHHPAASTLIVAALFGPPVVWSVSELIAGREFSEQLGVIEALLDAGDAQQALALALPLFDGWPDDRLLGSLHRRAVDLAAPEATDRMLEATTFSPRWNIEEQGHRRVAAAAAAHFARYPHEDLLFQVAFSRLLAAEPAGALALLEKHALLLQRSLLLRELHALVLLETEQYGAYNARAVPLDLEAVDRDTVGCLRAYRLLRAHAPRHQGLADGAALESALVELDAIVARKRRSTLARTVRVIAEMNAGHPDRALDDLAALDLATDASERAAVLAWRARATVEAAVPDSGSWEADWDEAFDYLDAAVQHDVRFVEWFCEQIRYPTGAHCFEGLRRLLSCDWVKDVQPGDRPWFSLVSAIVGLELAERRSEILELLDLVERSGWRPASAAGRERRLAANSLFLWALLRMSPEDIDVPPADPDEHDRLTRALEIFERKRAEGSATWEDHVAAGLVLARLCRIEPDPADAGRLRDTACELLQVAVDSSAVDAELSRVRSDPELDESDREAWSQQIREHVERCRRMLERLDA